MLFGGAAEAAPYSFGLRARGARRVRATGAVDFGARGAPLRTACRAGRPTLAVVVIVCVSLPATLPGPTLISSSYSAGRVVASTGTVSITISDGSSTTSSVIRWNRGCSTITTGSPPSNDGSAATPGVDACSSGDATAVCFGNDDPG